MKIIIFCSVMLLNQVFAQTQFERQLSENLVIAHRGTVFWAPEETEAAMRWARNIGADYLEFDLQRSKDGKLIALHDEVLLRTTNVAEKFSERMNAPVSAFTYQELLTLDAGSWFNISNKENARSNFEGLDILCLQDIIQIAEGKRICRDKTGKRITTRLPGGELISEYENDPADSGNRPGLYIETKVPGLFPGIESDLRNELIKSGWYNPDCDFSEKINNEKAPVSGKYNRVIVQTFSRESLDKLNQNFNSQVPKCFLLWKGNGPDDFQQHDIKAFENYILSGKNLGATIAGPSISGSPNNYTDLLTPGHYRVIKKCGLSIHAYSFDTNEQFFRYKGLVQGMFTNKADETLKLLGRLPAKTDSKNILSQLGY